MTLNRKSGGEAASQVATFDSDGKVTTDFGGALDPNHGERANAVGIQSDGTIVVAGTVGGRDFALAGYGNNGRLDGSFGRGGKVVTDFGSIWAMRGR